MSSVKLICNFDILFVLTAEFSDKVKLTTKAVVEPHLAHTLFGQTQVIKLCIKKQGQ